MTTQNLVDSHLTDEQWGAVDAAIDALEAALAPALVAMGAAKRSRLVKMGDGSEAFVRKAADVFGQNLGLLPRDFDLAEMRRDLASHDALDGRTVRLVQLMEKIRDTDAALGSDAMVAGLKGYQFIKHADGAGVEALRQMLGERFDQSGSRATPPAEPVPA
jgi:hypothetical protein